MLNDRERDVLVEIELELWLQDPGLAAALAAHRVPGGAGLVYDVVAGVSAALGMGCMALTAPGATEGGVVAFAFAVVTTVVRTWLFPRSGRSGGHR